MIKEFDGSIVYTPLTAITPTSNTGTALMSFSKLDSNGQPNDFAIIDVFVGTHATTTVAINVLSIVEDDSVTSPTSMTGTIASLTGTTDATSAIAIPGVAVTGVGAVMEFQLDLRKRKKYIGVLVAAKDIGATQRIGAIAKLYKSRESRDTSTKKSRTGATYGNLVATSAVGCAAVYQG